MQALFLFLCHPGEESHRLWQSVTMRSCWGREGPSPHVTAVLTSSRDDTGRNAGDRLMNMEAGVRVTQPRAEEHHGMLRDSHRTGVRPEPQRERGLASHLVSDLWPPGLWENTCLLS